MRPWVVFFMYAAIIASCGGPQVPAETQADSTTHYRPGDYIVYRYSGSFSEQPVSLEERIDRVEGNRLWIHVTASRGDERREWIQVVTDTAENREHNLIDELFEVREEGERIPLSNEDNRDLVRLYSWTLPPCEGRLEPRGAEMRSMTIAGNRFECSCISATQACSGRPAQMEACDCPRFLWTHASARVQVGDASTALWSVEVVEYGRRVDEDRTDRRVRVE